MDLDLKLAVKLYKELNNVSPEKLAKRKLPPPEGKPSKKSGCIVDPEWEITDPNPDIHMLFQVFNEKYFWGKLDSVEVKWSPRMYSCAGICTYKGKLGGCVVSLSLPLLKLRPRKDLVETLLHEMIHAFLFVADGNRDRGEHGPKFHEHMFRINKEAGTKITVYHTFHDEVKHYKQHWWRCNGPCQNEKPFFGLVKRSMNRTPGPNDFWFAGHQAKCGGEFIKIKEPEGFKSRKRPKNKTNEICKKKGSSSSTLHNFYPKVSSMISNSSIKTMKNENSSAKIDNYKKINNVYGFTNLSSPSSSCNNVKASGFGKTGLKSNMGGTLIVNPSRTSTTAASPNTQDCPKKSATTNGVASFEGVGYILGGSTGIRDRSKSILLGLYESSHSTSPKASTSQQPSSPGGETIVSDTVNLLSESDEEDPFIYCPVCNEKRAESSINEHLESCLQLESVFEKSVLNDGDMNQKEEFEFCEKDSLNNVQCPVCNQLMANGLINEHLEDCLRLGSKCERSHINADVIEHEDDLNFHERKPFNIVQCPVCGEQVPQQEINQHLDNCLT